MPFEEANSLSTRTHTFRHTPEEILLYPLVCLLIRRSTSLSERQGQGEAQKWTWYQNDSAVCLSLNMHKWISEESKCMRGSIKHFREHLRWKLLLGGAFFALFANMFEWRWGFKSIRTVCALCEYSATEYYDGSRGCKWNPTQNPISTHSNGSWPVQKRERAVFHTVSCTDC